MQHRNTISMTKAIEILSPAGEMSSLSAALKAGADSVYVGLNEFTMRAKAKNFSRQDLIKAASMCHKNNARLYVTMNTTLYEDQLTDFSKTLDFISSSGADAVIVSDLGALTIAKEKGIESHVSVQMNSTNSKTLNILKQLGASRVILSRELTLDHIAQLSKKTNVDIEAFVHGALCVSESGRCFLSSWLYNKNANCGDCLQPCRYEWTLTSEDGKEVQCGGTRLLSSKDLCMIDHIPELIRAGVNVFKIEGRMRNEHYVYTVTRAYRDIVSAYLTGQTIDSLVVERKKELKKVFNREFSTGFYFGRPSRDGYSPINGTAATHKRELIGVVDNYYEKPKVAAIYLSQHSLAQGDTIIFTGPTTGFVEVKVDSIHLDKCPVTKAEKKSLVGVKVPEKVRKNDRVFLLKKISSQ